MEGNLVDFLPCAGLFAPDEDLAVIRGGGEDVAVLGMCPCYTPYCAFMAAMLSALCFLVVEL